MWYHHQDGNLSVSLTQQSFVEMLIENLGFSTDTTSSFTTPYWSGISIDSIPPDTMSNERDYL